MSTERIKHLHEQASELYLSGDYQGALQAWRDVLGLDPANEQALGGVRLASQFVEHGAPAPAQATPEIEHELEQGLRVLDGLGATTLLHPDMADGAIDRPPVTDGDAGSASDEMLEGWGAPTAPPPDEGRFGLDPVSNPSPASGPPTSAAASELRRRVDDLLTEAKAKAEAGERDDALAILARLSILDEDNSEAEALRSKIEAASASDLDKVERAIIEGVAALESNQLDDAERYFREALALAPEHREAQHYLEKVEARRASGGEELLGAAGGESAPAADAVSRAIGADAATHAPAAAPIAPVPRPSRPPALAEPAELQPVARGPRFASPPPQVLILGGVGAVAVVCAAFALPHLLGGSPPNLPAPTSSVPKSASVSRPTSNSKSGGPPVAAAARTRAVPATPEERDRAVAADLAKGQALMASGDFAGAVVAFDEARVLDPANAAAKAGIAEAGEGYKASKAEREAINNIKLAFRDGEFTSGLRLAYRLPPTVSTSYADAVKVAGWYNLAVVALRAGSCREAQEHLDEALQIAPLDAEAKALREFAASYAEAVKDRVFLDRVEALSFRSPPPS